MKLINTLAKRKLKRYTVDSFEEFWLKDHEYEEYYGKSRRKRIQRKTLIEVYELWQGRLVLRLFYLEEGYRNLQIYRECREVVRYLAGSNKKLIKGVYASLNGTNCYTSESNYDFEWEIVNVDKYLLGNTPYYVQGFNWEIYNDYLPILKESIHKYSSVELIYNKENNFPVHMFSYLSKYDKSPILEVILKMKLEHLVRETHLFRNRFDTLPEILGVKKQDFCHLKNGMSLSFVRKYVNYLNKLSPAEAMFFWENRRVIEVFNLTDRKTLKYLTQVGDLYLYEDYLKFAKELGFDLKRNKVRFPIDLKTSHDAAFKKTEIVKSEQLSNEFLEQFKRNEDHIFYSQKLLIKPVKTPEELIEESKVLDHCVRSYSKEVARGETEILFVRKEKQPDKPFITVEVRDGKVRQVRGWNNTPPSEDVKSFLHVWSEKKGISYET